MEHVGDITRLDGRKLPPVDILTFGSPCQGLSMAGRRLGLADERSGLFMEAIRIIREMQEATHGEYPKFALWENVPGALSSAGGRDFKAVLEAFTKAEVPMPYSGRWANAGMLRSNGIDLAWCVYDAQYFGTAQRRRRVFLVADFTGRRAGQILFVPKSLRGYFEAGGTPRQGLTAFVENGSGTADASLIPAVTMRLRSGCEGGGKGPLCQIEKSGTLATHNDQYLFDPQKAETNGAGIGIDGYNGEITEDAAASGEKDILPVIPAVEILNDQGGASLTVEQREISPTLRSQTHGNLPVVALGFDLQQITSKTNRSTRKPVQPTLCGTGNPHALCMASAQANAEILLDKSLTLMCGHGQQPILVHPQIAGTLCASGAGLSRPAGMGSETDFCITCAGFRHKAGSAAGSVGYQEETAPTLLAGQQSSVVKAYVIGSYHSNSMMSDNPTSGYYEADTSRTLDLNGGNPCCNQGGIIIVGADGDWQGWELIVRRLTPVECERLQGFPDGWTEYGADGQLISDTSRYQMLGNSIAVPCVAYIMQGLVLALETR